MSLSSALDLVESCPRVHRLFVEDVDAAYIICLAGLELLWRILAQHIVEFKGYPLALAAGLGRCFSSWGDKGVILACARLVLFRSNSRSRLCGGGRGRGGRNECHCLHCLVRVNQGGLRVEWGERVGSRDSDGEGRGGERDSGME